MYTPLFIYVKLYNKSKKVTGCLFSAVQNQHSTELQSSCPQTSRIKGVSSVSQCLTNTLTGCEGVSTVVFIILVRMQQYRSMNVLNCAAYGNVSVLQSMCSYNYVLWSKTNIWFPVRIFRLQYLIACIERTLAYDTFSFSFKIRCTLI